MERWILRWMRLPSCMASFCAAAFLRLSISPERSRNSTKALTEIFICSIFPSLSISVLPIAPPGFRFAFHAKKYTIIRSI